MTMQTSDPKQSGFLHSAAPANAMTGQAMLCAPFANRLALRCSTRAAWVGGLFQFKSSVRWPLWHLADFPTAPAFVRFRTTADKSVFWPATVCPLMTQNGHH